MYLWDSQDASFLRREENGQVGHTYKLSEATSFTRQECVHWLIQYPTVDIYELQVKVPGYFLLQDEAGRYFNYLTRSEQLHVFDLADQRENATRFNASQAEEFLKLSDTFGIRYRIVPADKARNYYALKNAKGQYLYTVTPRSYSPLPLRYFDKQTTSRLLRRFGNTWSSERYSSS